jgi:FKBP-type peptidyl-prolyl cis-trans isomerase FklB
MKNIFPFIATLFFIAACGSNNSENKDEKVELKTDKDKLSYVLGSMSALTINSSQDPNVKQLDVEEMVKGFEMNLNGNDPAECDAELRKLFGQNAQDFDQKFIKSGSLCLGKISGYQFYIDLKKRDGLKDVDLKIAVAGFRDGLKKTDNLIPEKEKQTILLNFIKSLNQKSGQKMFGQAAKIKGVQKFSNGIYMQVIKEGKGGQPAPTDDVKVEYILTSALGDTIQSSYQMKKQTGKNEPVALKLNGGVIPGWSYIIPKMKKGGTYRVFIPWNLAYGEEGGRESLCFFIELIDYAKEGAFVKPQPAAMPNGGM